MISPAISIILRKIAEFNFRKQKNIIKEYFTTDKNESVLDLGCGTGEFSPFFPEESYIGIDIDERNINYAKAHYQRKFLTADAGKLPFDDNSFSKILILGVLHHLNDEDCLRVLEEAKRVLKPDGKMLVMEDIDTPNSGYFTRLMHYFDRGRFIRTKEEYPKLLSRYFTIEDNFFIRSGICTYQVFALINNPSKNKLYER